MHVLILDDDELGNFLMAEALRQVPDCTLAVFSEPLKAIEFLRANAAGMGLAIVDYDMPQMNGVEVIEAARAIEGLAHMPIMMITSHDQRAIKRRALTSGATDFLSKPVDAVEVAARASNLLALARARRAEADRAAELAREVAKAVAVVHQRERELVTLLMKAAEHRDTDTGDHVVRVAGYALLIAEALGFAPDKAAEISLASTMHDVGKLSVPDAILLKPGPLSHDERAEMERHAVTGSKILSASTSDLIRLAAEIAESHHERWDGAGYPHRLKGDDIPLSGRIVAVADVFDALTSDRPYKRAWTPERARQLLMDEAGTHFDPACVAAFLARWPDVLRIVDRQSPGERVVA